MTDVGETYPHHFENGILESWRPAQNAQTGVTDTRHVRGATFEDIAPVHALLMDAINNSPFYNDEFKAYETARLNKAYLAALVKQDPHHVMIPLSDGKPAGFMISSPDLGNLWLHWSYLAPEHRASKLVMRTMRAFVEYWEQNGRYHKVSTYVRPGNTVAEKLMERYKLHYVMTLKNHIFGQDYGLFERHFTKTVPGYDRGIGIGITGKLRYRLREMLSR